MYKKAVVSVEDHRFYKHHGIDVIAIGRATLNDLRAFSFMEGGSTITQQLAKNQYFTQEKKMTRKIAETFLAFKLEKEYEKDEIYSHGVRMRNDGRMYGRRGLRIRHRLERSQHRECLRQCRTARDKRNHGEGTARQICEHYEERQRHRNDKGRRADKGYRDRQRHRRQYIQRSGRER